jgi:hypothetical protein
MTDGITDEREGQHGRRKEASERLSGRTIGQKEERNGD